MLRLKEKPIEWIKFTAVLGVVLNAVVWLLWHQGRVPLAAGLAAVAVALLAVVTAVLRPRWFRGVYRAGMTVSFHIGQVIGRVLLTVLFFLVVTPLGLVLRLAGKDLLDLRRRGDAATWWREAKSSRNFDRMF